MGSDVMDISPIHEPQRKPSMPAAPSPTFEPLLDSDEAAALLRIHPKTLQRMAREGKIAAVHIGKLWRFRASVLNEWLESKLAATKIAS